ncbi:DUF4435 domain-containing protein [Herbaspirillum huttiense F1]|uniref:DUF4435 domain-containing protein n=1 Tax=Herbaspirillum huttiense TaxID=863372 RepID=UPI002887E924|nr:DUF4435 domain-containing protein [Herbaspirillum huttiense]MDT0357832.1 DUF4435 domain-containing protein [Herbaspirillum huttiense F1]
MSAHTDLTIDEIISTINRSNLPTVLIEGKDDAIVYRKLEEDCADLNLSIFPAGGRNKVLQVFDRRNELKNPDLIAYIVDRDYWIYSTVPAEYICERLVVTAGYSIENEVIVDGEVLMMMTPDERERFYDELRKFIKWYSLALHRNLSGDKQVKYDLHPDQILKLDLANNNHAEIYPEDLHNLLTENYLTHLRGKSLLALMLRQLSYARRQSRHNDKQIMETVKARPGPAIAKIFSDVSRIFLPNNNVAI